MKKLEELKQLIEKLNSERQGTIILNPVVQCEKVKEIEKKYKITLPAEYVEFITTVGDGAIIQSDIFGRQELLALGSYESDKHPLEKPNMPFPLERSWMPDWGDGIEGAEDEEDEDVLERLMDEQWEKIETQGNISLMSIASDDGSDWILITAGMRKGEVWNLSQYGAFRLAKCGFVRWLELFLNDKLDDFMAKCAKKEYPQDADQMEECKKIVQKEKIRMNPAAGMEEIRDFEKRHNISLPEDYVAFLTQIGNGAKKLPWYISNIYSLSDNDSQENLDKPFLVQTKEDYQRIFFENGLHKVFGGMHRGKRVETVWEYLFHVKPEEELKP